MYLKQERYQAFYAAPKRLVLFSDFYAFHCLPNYIHLYHPLKTKVLHTTLQQCPMYSYFVRSVVIMFCVYFCVQLFCKVKDMRRCFQKMAQFLQVTADSDRNDIISMKIGLAVDSLEGLWFTCNSDFITKAVSLSIDVWVTTPIVLSPNPTLRRDKCLLTLGHLLGLVSSEHTCWHRCG